ncbi:NADPH oxidase 4, partial [Ophiophagus hannah]
MSLADREGLDFMPQAGLELTLGLCLSRASAAVLNLNCSLVLLPVCRVLLALLRGSQKSNQRRRKRHGSASRQPESCAGEEVMEPSEKEAEPELSISLQMEKERRAVEIYGLILGKEEPSLLAKLHLSSGDKRHKAEMNRCGRQLFISRPDRLVSRR